MISWESNNSCSILVRPVLPISKLVFKDVCDAVTLISSPWVYQLYAGPSQLDLYGFGGKDLILVNNTLLWVSQIDIMLAHEGV